MNLLGKNIDLNLPAQPDEPVYSNVQLTRLFTFIKSGLTRVLLLGLVVASSNFAFTGLTTASGRERDDRLQRTDTRAAQDREAIRKQSVGSAVSNCAFQNIARDAVADIFTDAEINGILIGDNAKLAAFYDRSRTRLAHVNCKALAPKADQIKIQLVYPTTIPPPP